MPPKDQIAPVIALLEADMRSLHPEHRAVLERARIAPYEISVADDSGAIVVAVANLNGKLLYWSEIEEGWELGLLNDAGKLPSCGTSQYELSHVLHQVLGVPQEQKSLEI